MSNNKNNNEENTKILEGIEAQGKDIDRMVEKLEIGIENRKRDIENAKLRLNAMYKEKSLLFDKLMDYLNGK